MLALANDLAKQIETGAANQARDFAAEMPEDRKFIEPNGSPLFPHHAARIAVIDAFDRFDKLGQR